MTAIAERFDVGQERARLEGHLICKTRGETA